MGNLFRKLTQQEVETRLQTNTPHLELADIYVRQTVPCKFYDSRVGEYFYAKPKDIFRGHTTGHPSLSRTKQEETNLKKYGAKCSLQNKEVKQKIKNTMVERYGVENPSQSEEIKKKKEDTCKSNYGVASPMQNAGVRDKMKSTYLAKTGYDNPFNNPECMEKAKQTSLQKYGTLYPMQSDVVQQKSRVTSKENWGHTHPMKNPQVRERQLASITASMKAGSKPEAEVLDWVRSLGVEAKKSYLGGQKPCEIDIMCYLSEGKRMGIEFNGDFWHSEAHMPKHYHYNKTKMAMENGVELIHIFQSEWRKSKDVIKSYIKAKLGKCERQVFAHRCEVREVTKDETAHFFTENHLQGKPTLSTKTLGLYYNDELVSAASFSGRTQLQLSRFTDTRDCLVVGGLSKLCKHAFQNLGEFISFVHLRLGYGNAFYKAGFKHVATVKPNYWYFDTNRKRIVTKQARKSIATPEGMSEHEHALKDGLVRVYDCGKLKFLYSAESSQQSA